MSVASAAKPGNDPKSPAKDITVMELGTTERAHWDCANLFSEGRLDEIQRYAEQAVKQKNMGAYDMLFGILRMRGDKDTFEAVALDFTVESGQSPPNWLEMKAEDKPAVEPETINVPSLGAADVMGLVIRLESPDPVRLTMGAVQKADPKGIDQVNVALNERIERGEQTIVTNEGAFINSLAQRAKTAGKSPAVIPLWNFIFNIYRLTGRYDDFERDAGDFISLFGEEQLWRDLSGKNNNGAAAAAESGEKAQDDALFMPAKLMPPYDIVIKKCMDVEDGDVVIDFSMVKNTNMPAIFNMITVMRVATDGWKKRVHLRNVNEIVAAMIRIFGGDKHMQISIQGSNS